MEKYSVLMSIYKNDNAQFFKEAIESMLTQTIKPDEIVIVEDGELTNELYLLLDKLRKMYPSIIRRCRNKHNRGLGIALRNGLKVCRNELIVRMDSDDISIPQRCELQLQYMEKNPEVDIVGGQIEEFIGSVDNIVGKRIVPTEHKELLEYTKKRCPFNHVSVMFRKSSVLDVGNYIELHYNEDYYLWIRMALAGKRFGNLDQTLVKVRVGEDMYRRRGGLAYFKSEEKLQWYMLRHSMISPLRYCFNTLIRFVLQVLTPNRLRGVLFKILARR